jgi:DUF4097 and DUF4098 domain-containing protein YvlB
MSPTRPSRAGWARLAPVLLLLPLLAMAGCAAIMANLVKAKSTEQRSFTASARPSVIVDTYNGPITVNLTSENKVEATVTKTGSGASKETADADLKNVSVAYSQDGETVRIVARRTGPKTFGSSGAAVDLKVPAGAILSLTTSNGEITSEGIQGQITARSSNGKVDVRGAKGKLDLETSNGAIAIDATEATLSAGTSNGGIHFAGTLDKGKHTLGTSNGSIDLVLPAAAQFQFAASTSNGAVTNRFPGLQPSSGKPGSNRLAGRIGSGSNADIDLKLETSNGSITLEPMTLAEAPRP